MTHQNCLTCQHGQLRNIAPEDQEPRMANWCQRHNVFWFEACRDYVEAEDLIDIPGRGDSGNHA